MTNIRSYRELRVYQAAMDAAMMIYEMTRSFPTEEKYSMVDQMRRSSRSVCTNLGEAWHKRRYPMSFISKLNDAESEAEETRVWLEFAFRCRYIVESQLHDLDRRYDQIVRQLVVMSNSPDSWAVISPATPSPRPRVSASPRPPQEGPP